MSSVIIKKKKSLLPKIISRIKGEFSSAEQEGISSNVSLDDVRMTDKEMATIASRRNELKTAKWCNSDAVVIFNDL